MIVLEPAVLEGHGIRLEPLTEAHGEALARAATDGRLWELWFTTVPPPEGMPAYIADALKGQREGHMLPWAVRDLASGDLVGTTRYHDIVPAIDRVEIGYTWYAQSRQRTNVNTTCKLLLLAHAFDTLGCRSSGSGPTTSTSARSAPSRGWAPRRDGVIRHHASRRDGTVRDTVMYSILASEWRDVRRHLELRLHRHAPTP